MKKKIIAVCLIFFMIFPYIGNAVTAEEAAEKIFRDTSEITEEKNNEDEKEQDIFSDEGDPDQNAEDDTKQDVNTDENIQDAMDVDPDENAGEEVSASDEEAVEDVEEESEPADIFEEEYTDVTDVVDADATEAESTQVSEEELYSLKDGMNYIIYYIDGDTNYGMAAPAGNEQGGVKERILAINEDGVDFGDDPACIWKYEADSSSLCSTVDGIQKYLGLNVYWAGMPYIAKAGTTASPLAFKIYKKSDAYAFWSLLQNQGQANGGFLGFDIQNKWFTSLENSYMSMQIAELGYDIAVEDHSNMVYSEGDPILISQYVKDGGSYQITLNNTKADGSGDILWVCEGMDGSTYTKGDNNPNVDITTDPDNHTTTVTLTGVSQSYRILPIDENKSYHLVYKMKAGHASDGSYWDTREGHYPVLETGTYDSFTTDLSASQPCITYQVSDFTVDEEGSYTPLDLESHYWQTLTYSGDNTRANPRYTYTFGGWRLADEKGNTHLIHKGEKITAAQLSS